MFHRHITGPQIQVIVGTGRSQKTYTLPKALLIEKSPYFRGCLSGNFIESSNSTVTLEDISPMSFRYFVHWMYKAQLAACKDEDLPELWILADRLICPQLKNRAMDLLRESHKASFLDIDVVKDVVEKLPTDSLLADYYLTQLAYDLDDAYYKNSAQRKALDEMLIVKSGVALKFVDLLKKQSAELADLILEDPAEEEGCLWHDHADEPSIYECPGSSAHQEDE